MTRRYITLALAAFLAYSLVPPLLKLAVRDLPSTPAVFLSNTVLLVLVGGVLLVTGRSPTAYLTRRTVGYVTAIGVVLAVGLLTYYRALALGPVSVVVPIYGLFIPASSAVGMVVFDEAITARKLAGIGFAVAAIILVSA